MGNKMAILPKLYCWQFDTQFPLPVSGTEDCLYMNIYRPKVSHNRPLNVVVFFHGGGFYSGNNNPLFYGPDFFMETGQVILVTISYRLNVFGFLATGDSASPGNYGLKDQTMALRWINRHIGAFGGNPSAVTLMGQSAGAVAINYHLVSRQSEGLYKNVIMLSGTIDTPWAQPRQRPRALVNHHARTLGIKNAHTLSSQVLVAILRTIPAKELTQALVDARIWDLYPVAAYTPAVEPPGSPEPFLTVHPRVSMARGDFVKVPVMASTVPGEGINFVQPLIRLNNRHQEFNARMYRLLPIVLNMNPSHPNMTEIVNRIRFRYFGPIGKIGPHNFDSVLQMASDYYIGHPFYTSLQSLAKHMPVYAHYFDYKGLNSFSTIFTRTIRNYGVVHVDDLLYLFRFKALFPLQLDPTDVRAKNVFMKHFLKFILISYPGYDEWNETAPTMARFRNSEKAIVKRDTVYVKRHEFWQQIQEIYDFGWSISSNRRSGSGECSVVSLGGGGECQSVMVI